jgi:hypothetical protein
MTMRVLLTKLQMYDASACLHDYAVRNRVALGLTLMQCHALFREALEARHVGRGLRNAMYGAVVAVNWTCAGPGDGSPFCLELADGDLLVMDAPTQKHWLHALPERRRVVGERINLTFRRIETA